MLYVRITLQSGQQGVLYRRITFIFETKSVIRMYNTFFRKKRGNVFCEKKRYTIV